jgi:hypothetical protein
MVRIQSGSELEEAAVHPFISMLLAEQRIADMRADADRRRLVRAAIEERRAQRHATRQWPPSRLGPAAEQIIEPASTVRLVRTAAGPDSCHDSDPQLCHAASN